MKVMDRVMLPSAGVCGTIVADAKMQAANQELGIDSATKWFVVEWDDGERSNENEHALQIV